MYKDRYKDYKKNSSKNAFIFAQCYATELYEFYLNDKNYEQNPNWQNLSNTKGINKLCSLLEQYCPNKDYHVLVGNFYHHMKNDYYVYTNLYPGDTDNRVIWRVYGQLTDFMPYNITRDRPDLYLAHAYFMYDLGIVTYEQFLSYREYATLALINFGLSPTDIKDMFTKEISKKVLPMDLLNSL